MQEAAEKEIEQMQQSVHAEAIEASSQESSLQGTEMSDSTDQSVPVVLSLPEDEELRVSTSAVMLVLISLQI